MSVFVLVYCFGGEGRTSVLSSFCLFASAVFLERCESVRYLCYMVKVSIQIKGVEALKKRLMEKKQVVDNVLGMMLSELGEKAVTFSKENKGYKDRTANLKNSISFAVFCDGKLINKVIGSIPEPDKVKGGQSQVDSILEEYASKDGVVAPKGYTIIVVAGMSYAKHVEDKGYNVLYLTRHFLNDGIKAIAKELLEMMRK